MRGGVHQGDTFYVKHTCSLPAPAFISAGGTQSAYQLAVLGAHGLGVADQPIPASVARGDRMYGAGGGYDGNPACWHGAHGDQDASTNAIPDPGKDQRQRSPLGRLDTSS